jgi:hypothetical protein
MSTNDILVDGVCEVCGAPGTVGISCSECSSPRVVAIDEPAATAATETHYADDLLKETDPLEDMTAPESLEELAEKEIEEKEDDETL